MAKAQFLSWVGIAKEVTPGTAVTATAFIPADPAMPDEKMTKLVDDSSRGSNTGPFAIGHGPGSVELSLSGKVYADTFGWLLAAICGDVVTTGSSAPFAHAFASQNGASVGGQPSSYTITLFTGLTASGGARRIAGCKCTELVIKANVDGFLEWTAKFVGYPSAIQASPPTPVWPSATNIPAEAWRESLLLGGVADATLLDFEITLSRSSGKAVHTMAGTVNPALVWVGKLMAKGKLTLLPDTEQRLLDFIANTQPALDLSFLKGSGSTQTGLQIHCSQIAYDEGTKLAAGDGDLWQIDAPFDAIANTTDAGASGGFSPAKVTLTNAVAASTYV